eukprot:353268-Chlamydomonas_euryale.AAC.13
MLGFQRLCGALLEDAPGLLTTWVAGLHLAGCASRHVAEHNAAWFEGSKRRRRRRRASLPLFCLFSDPRTSSAASCTPGVTSRKGLCGGRASPPPHIAASSRRMPTPGRWSSPVPPPDLPHGSLRPGVRRRAAPAGATCCGYGRGRSFAPAAPLRRCGAAARAWRPPRRFAAQWLTQVFRPAALELSVRPLRGQPSDSLLCDARILARPVAPFAVLPPVSRVCRWDYDRRAGSGCGGGSASNSASARAQLRVASWQRRRMQHTRRPEPPTARMHVRGGGGALGAMRAMAKLGGRTPPPTPSACAQPAALAAQAKGARGGAADAGRGGEA